MKFEVKCNNKTRSARTYAEADSIYKRLAHGDEWTRLYCIYDGRRSLLKSTSKKLRKAS